MIDKRPRRALGANVGIFEPAVTELLAGFLALGHATVLEARRAATAAGDGELSWELLQLAADVEIGLLNLAGREVQAPRTLAERR